MRSPAGHSESDASRAGGASEASEAGDDPRRLRAQGNLVRTAICRIVVNVTTLGSVATLLLLAVGGNWVQVGVLAMVLKFGLCGQLVGLQVLRRVGKARLASTGRLMGLAPMAALVGLVMFGGTGPGAAVTVIVAYAGLALVLSTANTGWWPLLQDNASGDGMGRFFTRMRAWLRGVQITVPLLAGYYLGTSPSPRRFLLLLGVGAAGIVAGSWFIRRVPETPRPSPDAGLFLRLRLAARARTVRPYLAFIFVYMLLAGAITPFWVVMYRVHGLGVRQIVWLTSIAALGHIVSLRLWGWVVDRHGGRPALGISLALQGVMGLAWLGLPAGGTPLLIWAVSFSLLWGFSESGCQMGRTSAMFRAVPPAYQADSFTLTMFSAAAGGVIGALAGGWLFQHLSDIDLRVLGLDGRLVALGGLQVCLLAAWGLSRRLAAHAEETPARVLVGGLVRRIFGQT